MKLKIDNRELEIEQPVSIYHAAEQLGINIPVMCYRPGQGHITSCMICMVKDKATGRLLPACSAPVSEGMDIETLNDEIRGFRKATLELLLSDHVGDCEGPCQRLCTVHLEIPRMIRAIMAGDMESAIAIVREEMALPAILERYCTAPCEKGCRRAKQDEALSIRELTRFVADWDLKRPVPCIPPRKPSTGKQVAVIGAGATGLSAAYFLALAGHACTVYEQAQTPGGRLRAEFRKDLLGDEIVEGEMRVLRGLGISFHFGQKIGPAEFAEIRAKSSAVIYAPGACAPADHAALGITLKVDPNTGMTALPGIFAGGSVLKAKQPLAKSVFAGKNVAAVVTQHLAGLPMTGVPDVYNHTMGRLLDGEIEVFLRYASPASRHKPADLELRGFEPGQAAEEGARCLHCDCRKNHDCKLRQYSDEYHAEQGAFKGEERARHVHIDQNSRALYEPEKCIKCGLCVRICEAHSERFGFTFVGRGFTVRPGIALDKTLSEGLEKVACEVVSACPTGALSDRKA